jgi:hypothetical protein
MRVVSRRQEVSEVDNCEEHDGDGERCQDADVQALLLPIAKCGHFERFVYREFSEDMDHEMVLSWR